MWRINYANERRSQPSNGRQVQGFFLHFLSKVGPCFVVFFYQKHVRLCISEYDRLLVLILLVKYYFLLINTNIQWFWSKPPLFLQLCSYYVFVYPKDIFYIRLNHQSFCPLLCTLSSPYISKDIVTIYGKIPTPIIACSQ